MTSKDSHSDNPDRQSAGVSPLPQRILGIATAAVAACSSIWIFLVMCMVCADVLARSFADSPIAGVAEVVAFSVPACVFLAIPYTVRTGRFLRADFLFSGFMERSPRGGALLSLSINAAGALVFIRILGSVWPRLLGEIADNEFFGSIGAFTAPTYPFTAAITGSSIASATVFTRVATPEMERHGYTSTFAVGVVAGSSVLGMLIPPSLLLLIYGLIAEVSIGALLAAAIIRGLILAGVFPALVILPARFAPGFVGDTTPSNELSAVSSGEFLRRMSILALIDLVLAGIYVGFCTPTESGAVGAAGTLLIALVRRSLKIAGLRKILLETAEISGAILLLVESLRWVWRWRQPHRDGRVSWRLFEAERRY